MERLRRAWAGTLGGLREHSLRSVLGPLGPRSHRAKAGAVIVTVGLTVLTQVGGLVLWPFWAPVFESTRDQALVIRWPARLLLLTAAYLVGCQVLLPPLAHQAGRVRLPWRATEAEPIGPLTALYPLLNRNYVRPSARQALVRAAVETSAHHPGTVVRYLDAGFPFAWPPLLPHLSHADGQRIDLALLFEDGGVPVDGARSPIGYWGYAKESRERPECEGTARSVGPLRFSLRWDFEGLQSHLPDLDLDVERNRSLFEALAAQPTVCSLLLEPTLHRLLRSPKLVANPCGVARHDDHVHVTVRSRCP